VPATRALTPTAASQTRDCGRPVMPLKATGSRSVSCHLNRNPAEVGSAREQARKALYGWGLGEHSELAALVVSELVTNALCHGEGPIWMRLSAGGGELRVEVHDGGGGRPVRRHAGGGDECGRGLELLDGLIELHGGERGLTGDPAGPGKTVYVVLSLEAAPAGAR
jgi:anti-sigma regulatory factor (Ser/Thr protein kinase)